MWKYESFLQKICICKRITQIFLKKFKINKIVTNKNTQRKQPQRYQPQRQLFLK